MNLALAGTLAPTVKPRTVAASILPRDEESICKLVTLRLILPLASGPAAAAVILPEALTVFTLLAIVLFLLTQSLIRSTSRLTNEVLATLEEISPAGAVGTVGVPIKLGESFKAISLALRPAIDSADLALAAIPLIFTS